MVWNNYRTGYDSFRDKMDTTDYINMSPNIMENSSNVNSELYIPSDIYTMILILE